VFDAEGFDCLRAIGQITETDLEAMKVKRGHRRMILAEVDQEWVGYEALLALCQKCIANGGWFVPKNNAQHPGTQSTGVVHCFWEQTNRRLRYISARETPLLTTLIRSRLEINNMPSKRGPQRKNVCI